MGFAPVGAGKGPAVERYDWSGVGGGHLGYGERVEALRREGQSVGAWTFLKLGALVMPPALVLAVAGAFVFSN